MKINNPKITNYEVSSFNECIINNEFNKVLINENSNDFLDLTEYT